MNAEQIDDMRGEVIRGLSADRKTLPPKFFYDEIGAQLFERICELDEYYLTRAEVEILRAHADEIAQIGGPGCTLVEYGSGAGTKVRVLFDALDRPAAYVPIDLSTEQLNRVALDLRGAYPHLRVEPICADYTRRIELPATLGDGRRLVFFPGSTIGNFHPPEAAAFLGRIRETLGADGALILGIDRRKCAAILDAAYDDAAGITAEFNRNVLRRINRDLGADFELADFRHRAVFNDAESRVEMHLETSRELSVRIDDRRFDFARGETIWTESSYKYDEERLATLVGAAGFQIARLWTDSRDYFWVCVLVAND